MEAGAYPSKPKKGKKWPTAPLRKRFVATCSTCVAVVGPDFVGCTTLLQALEQHGFTITFLGDKPSPTARLRFQEEYLHALVAAWEQLVVELFQQLGAAGRSLDCLGQFGAAWRCLGAALSSLNQESFPSGDEMKVNKYSFLC